MADENLKSIGKLGGIITLILLAYTLATMVIMLGAGGPPTTAQEILDMLLQNRLMGLLRLDALTTLVMPLYYERRATRGGPGEAPGPAARTGRRSAGGP